MSARPLSRLRWAVLACTVLGASCVVIANVFWDGQLTWTVVAVLGALFLAWRISAWATQPLQSQLGALANAAHALREGDYSFEIARDTRTGPIDLLAQAYNNIVEGLRTERLEIHQREHVLDALVYSAPQSLFLLDESKRIVLDNPAARILFQSGGSLVGHALGDDALKVPGALREALEEGRDGFITVTGLDGDETYQLQRRSFSLRGQSHTLWQIHSVTHDMARQEIVTWKKVIRVISHEVNNSMAPVSSLAHSALKLVDRRDFQRVGEVLQAIADRSTHLSRFIDSYAEFARVPEPQREWISLAALLNSLQQALGFQWEGAESEVKVWADRAQLGQALINLIKNAHESGSPVDEIRVLIDDSEAGVTLRVQDRGRGMSEAAKAQALLPFYTTKPDGNGLGLALVRDIVLAHNGRISLWSREGGGARASLGVEVRVFLPKPSM